MKSKIFLSVTMIVVVTISSVFYIQSCKDKDDLQLNDYKSANQRLDTYKSTWNSMFKPHTGIEFKYWRESGKINSEQEKSEIINKITDPANVWLLTGNVDSAASYKVVKLIDCLAKTSDSAIIDWKQGVADKITVGAKLFTIQWQNTKNNIVFETTAVLKSDSSIWECLSSNIILPSETQLKVMVCEVRNFFDPMNNFVARYSVQATAKCAGGLIRDCLAEVDGGIINGEGLFHYSVEKDDDAIINLNCCAFRWALFIARGIGIDYRFNRETFTYTILSAAAVIVKVDAQYCIECCPVHEQGGGE